MYLGYFKLAAIFVLYLAFSDAEVRHEVVKNDKGATEFIVIDGHHVEVPNRHRHQKPTLKFSIPAAIINRVEKHNPTTWSLKLDDSSAIDINVREINPEVTEYDIVWHHIARHPNREICLHYQRAHWFQGYQSNETHWPMDVKKHMERAQFNSMLELERLSGTGSFYQWREFQFILEHFFTNSDGFAMHLNMHQPLFIRRTPNGNDAQLCFSVDIDNHYYSAKFHNDADLNLQIRLFASTNIRTVTDYVVHHSTYLPIPSAIPTDLDIFRYPTWFSEEVFTQANMLPYAANLSSRGLAAKGETLVIEHDQWIDYLDEYNVNTVLFPQLNGLATSLQGKGARLGGTINSPRLQPTKKHPEYSKYIVYNEAKFPVYLIDVTLPEGAQFFSNRLKKLHNDHKISNFWLKSFIFNIPSVFHDPAVTKYPSLYVPRYIEVASKATNATVISEVGYKSQHLPVFYRLVNYFITPPQKLLRQLIPNVLSVSMSGYSFLVPYSIGGFDLGAQNINEEIYIRLLQATTFMPSMSFTRVPWSFSQKAVDLTKKFTQLHTEHADTIIELAKRRIKDGSPIVRPMWYASPDDAKTYTIGDQFMLGENIVVAPVVVEGQRERNVYLPAGTWIDQHGKSFKGPGDFKVAAPIEELPFFKRAEHY